MAKGNPTDPDRRIAGAASADPGAAQGEFTAAGEFSPWVPLSGRFFMGAWAGSVAPVGGQVQLQCTFDAGTTVLNCTLPSGADNLWTVPIAYFPEGHTETDFEYRIFCAALTSGRIAWRLSQ